MERHEAFDRVLQLLSKHNPFYLLSALSMLAGCYTLAHALRLEAGQSWKLLVLLGTLHVYEFLLIGLALFLIKRRALPRDGAMLLRLEVLFLVDATLLNAEVFAADILLGAIANFAGLILAAVKLGLILNVLGARLGPLGSAAYGHGLALLVAVPGLFTLLAQARVLSVATVYTAWWPLGLLIVSMALAVRPARRDEQAQPAAAAFLRTLAIAVPVSLALHLVTSAWVYHVAFHVSYLGPVLIGLGIARMLVEVPHVGREWCLRLPALGVLLSLGGPAALTVRGPMGIVVSPLREALVGAALGYLVGWRVLGERAFAWAAAACLTLGAAGHSLAAIGASASAILRGLKGGAGRLVPKTAVAWGALAVTSAFVLLGLGAWVSLFKNGARR
jgi:hypothetical protein